MSTRSSFTRKNKRLQCLFVLTVSVVGIPAIFFVGYEGRCFYLLPGMVFLMFAVAAIGILCQVCCELVSRMWPKATGFIRRAIIVRSYMPNGGKCTGNSSPQHAYSIAVDYDYAVAGKRHKGTRVSFVEKDYNSWKEADCARRPLLQNKNINVYYCPLIPSWSCIAHVQLRDIVIGVSAVGVASAVSLVFTLFAFYYLP